MSERSQLTSRLRESKGLRASYTRAKLNVLIPAQIRALRLRNGWTQQQFAEETGMKQSRVSAMERPGAASFSVETLVRSAAAFGVGLEVRFVSFGEMLAWESGFRQDAFSPTPITEDESFLNPPSQLVASGEPIHLPSSTSGAAPEQGEKLEFSYYWLSCTEPHLFKTARSNRAIPANASRSQR